ncbi:MAG: protein jag [Oscillospiraceae bacterium]|nr:protein jag [Oscillospiraceae bacterium]
MAQFEATGKTIEEAISNACSTAGVDRDSVSVEVLENPKSGFLGIGGQLAKVRVTYEEAIDNSVEGFLSGLFQHMGVEATATVTETEDGNLAIDLAGENMGLLIGRRGETLDALQHITNLVVNRGAEKHVRVTMDTENYRQKREESLIRLAKKTASQVVKYRRNRTLEPMNAYERHVIHTALQEFENVDTSSVGTEPNRRVVISYTGPDAGRSSGNYRRGGYSSGY